MNSFQRRSDIARDIIHFTKGESPAAAFEVFARIVAERRLRGGTGFIKGNYTCVCFTEAPLADLAEVFARTAAERLRYMPFGILLPKNWLFERGGRPVIYQSEAEFIDLPASLRYRHVRYEPTSEPAIDFSWEREWRVQTNELSLDPGVSFLVLPSQEYLDELMRQHERAQDDAFELNSIALGSQLAEQLREPFIWSSYLLEPPELPQYKGFSIPHAV
jgi:hypothetical protein